MHAINGVLLFLLCMSLGVEGTLGRRDAPASPGGRDRALGGNAHLLDPSVQIEAVTTIVGRSELFSACFFMSAWLLFRRGHTVVAAVLFFLALLSKENAIVLVVLALDVALSPKTEATPSNRSRLRSFAVLLSTAAAYLALRFYVLGGLDIPLSAQYMGGRLSYVERLMTSGRVFLEYVACLSFQSIWRATTISTRFRSRTLQVGMLGSDCF